MSTSKAANGTFFFIPVLFMEIHPHARPNQVQLDSEMPRRLRRLGKLTALDQSKMFSSRYDLLFFFLVPRFLHSRY